MSMVTKFTLKLKDGTDARSLEEIREHGDLESVLGYYRDGRLFSWLNVWKFEEKSEELKKISEDLSKEKNLVRKNGYRSILKSLGIEFTENELTEYCQKKSR